MKSSYLNKNGKLGVALLSFAHFHMYQWVEAFLESDEVEIVGFWDDNEERAETIVRDKGLKWYRDIESLISDELVTCAGICAETDKHKDLIRMCAEHDLGIMCEKPTATSSADCEAIGNLLKEKKVPYLQVFPQRLVPANIMIKEILDSGRLGRITHVRKRHGHGFALNGLDRQMPWIVDAKASGGGAYMDEGVHEADLLHYYFGKPLSVCAKKSAQKCGDGEMSAVAVYEFPGDIIAVHEAGWNWVAGGPTTEIYGTEGVLIESQTDCASSIAENNMPGLSIYDKKTNRWEVLLDNFEFGKVHRLYPKYFIDMLLRGKEPAASIDDGYVAVAMVEAVYRSIEEEATVKMKW